MASTCRIVPTNPCPTYPNAKCIVYTGSALSCLGVLTNDRLDTILSKINDVVCTLEECCEGGGGGSVTIEEGDNINITGSGTDEDPYIISVTGISQNFWSLIGNSGTSGATNFLGTTDNQPLRIRTNNTARAVFDTSGRFGLNTASPTERFSIDEKLWLYEGGVGSENHSVIKAANGQTLIINGGNTNSGISLIPNAYGTTPQIQISEGPIDPNRIYTSWFGSGATEQARVGMGANNFYIDAISLDTSVSFKSNGVASVYIDDSRFSLSKGADVASANDLNLGYDGNMFLITGSTQINAIIDTNWLPASIIYLRFQGTPLIKHNTAGGVNTSPIKLAGNIDWTPAVGDGMTLQYDGTDFLEVGRFISGTPMNAVRFAVAGEDDLATANRYFDTDFNNFTFDNVDTMLLNTGYFIANATNVESAIWFDDNTTEPYIMVQGMKIWNGANKNNQNTMIGAFPTTYTGATANTVVGYNTLRNINAGTASSNTVIGALALAANLSGGSNTAIGKSAMSSGTTPSLSVAVGVGALTNSNASWNVAIGNNALLTNVTGQKNVAIGYASQQLSTVSLNTSLGDQTLQACTTGEQNVAVGANALWLLTTGEKNVAVGAGAGEDLTTGGFNIALGPDALLGVTTGFRNVGIGWNAGAGIIAGTHNISIGYASGTSLSSGDHNIFIGGLDTGNNVSQATTVSNSVAIGSGAYTTASNQMVLGTDSFTETIVYSDNIRFVDYPSSRDDGNATKFLTTDVSGNVKLMDVDFSGASVVITADNGLTKDTATNVQLGGTLLKDTTIDAGATFALIVNGTNTDGTLAEGALKVNNTLNTGSITTAINASVSGTNASSVAIVGLGNGSTCGVQGQAVGGGTGVIGLSSSGAGVNGQSTSGTGVTGQSSSGAGGSFSCFASSTNTILNALLVGRSSTGTAANGIGAAISIQAEDSSTQGNEIARITAHWTDVTTGTRTGDLGFYTTNSTTSTQKLNISGAGIFTITQGLSNYVDDAAAAAGGIPVNGLYRNGSVVQIRVS
jgi:hypothetical protein